MKNPKLNAYRWLRQSEYDLKQARKNLEDKSYAYACFFAEQSAQKALKAILYLNGARFINLHSIKELLKEVSIKHGEFKELVDDGAKLDQYYLSARYPDAVPEPAIPAELLVWDQAREAIEIAEKIYKKSEKIINKTN